MPSISSILCHPFLLLPSIFPRIRVFSNYGLITEMKSITILKARSLISRCIRGRLCSLWSSREATFLASKVRGAVSTPWIPWLVATSRQLLPSSSYHFLLCASCCGLNTPISPVSASGFTFPPPLLSVCLLSVRFSCGSILRTLLIGFRAHFNNPGWSPHLKTFNSICRDPLFFPNRETFTHSRHLIYLWGNHHSIQHTMSFKVRKGNREVNGFYFNKLIAQSETGLCS